MAAGGDTRSQDISSHGLCELTLYDKQVLVFHKEGFQQPT